MPLSTEDETLLSLACLWVELHRAGLKMVEIAKRHRCSVSKVRALIEHAELLEEELERRRCEPVRVPRDHEPPRTLVPLLPMGGRPYTKATPCPRHPGPGHPNPRWRKWKNSSFVCVVCHASGMDHAIRLDFKDIPKRDPKPARPPKPRPTRRERRKKKFANRAVLLGGRQPNVQVTA
jgi:hypothetical protein